MNSFRRALPHSLSRIALALAAVLSLGFDADAAARKMLVITQSRGFVHNPVRRPAPDQLCLVEQTLHELGTKTGLFTTVNSQNAIEALTSENLARFDAVFFYTTGILLPSGTPREALTDFVKSGKAFLGTHSATDTFHGSGKEAFMDYVQMINGSFNGHPWGAGTTCTFANHEPSHPVVAMFGPEFQWKDEIYQYNNYDGKAVRVLFSLDMAKTNPKRPYLVPVCWVREFGSGRLFYTNLGHNDATWKEPKFHEHLLAGFKWATRQLDGPAAPNPAVQQAHNDHSIVAYAAALAGKEAAPFLVKAKSSAAWLAGVKAAADAAAKAQDAVGAIRDPDAKKTKPEELDAQRAAAKEKRTAAQAKFDEEKQKLVVALEK